MLSSFGKLLHPMRSLIRQSGAANSHLRLMSTETSASITVSTTTSSPVSVQSIARAASPDGGEPDQLYSKLEIELKGNDPAVLKSYAFFANTAATHLGIDAGKSWALRKPVHNRFVLLKSVHIYKKHRVHYEIRTYFRFMHFHRLTGSTLATFLEYIQRSLPEGVAMKTTRVEVQALPEHLREAPAQV